MIRFVVKIGQLSFSAVKGFVLAYVTTLNWGNVCFTLTAYVGADQGRSNQQDSFLHQTACHQQGKRETQVQQIHTKTLSPQYFIKLKKNKYTYLWYLNRLFFAGVQTFNVQLQGDFSQFSSGTWSSICFVGMLQVINSTYLVTLVCIQTVWIFFKL